MSTLKISRKDLEFMVHGMIEAARMDCWPLVADRTEEIRRQISKGDDVVDPCITTIEIED